jgi:hypothetical protein
LDRVASNRPNIIFARKTTSSNWSPENAEKILHPDVSSLGAVHDFVEADAFAKIAVAAQPAVQALIKYCEEETRALILANLDIVNALVDALIEHGILSGDQVNERISHEVAMRLIKIEHQRRDDWRVREKNAVSPETWRYR